MWCILQCNIKKEVARHRSDFFKPEGGGGGVESAGIGSSTRARPRERVQGNVSERANGRRDRIRPARGVPSVRVAVVGGGL